MSDFKLGILGFGVMLLGAGIVEYSVFNSTSAAVTALCFYIAGQIHARADSDE